MSSALEKLRKELDDEPGLVLDDPGDTAAYAVDWTGKFRGSTPLVLRPATTQAVARILAACNRHGVAVVPQGGNTGMVGGSTPRAGEVVISLSRMNAIEALDRASGTVQAAAGVVLQTLHERVAEDGFVFPVDLGGRGSCQIGGMIATNAGGIKVLRYGHMREQVRGLEVVLADGTVVSNLNRLKKDNTGIDVKQMFVSSEGILGIITRAVLQLQPAPEAVQTALLAVPSRSALPDLLFEVRARFRGLSSLEFVLRDAVDLVRSVEPSVKAPFAARHPVYVVLEEEGQAGPTAREGFLERLGGILESGLAVDAVVAESEAQARDLWRLREGPPEAIGRVGLTHKFDVTVPPGAIPAFLDEIEGLAPDFPGFRIMLYGHLGDGNVHVNMVQGADMLDADFHAAGDGLADRIYHLVAGHQGSVSAEHGIGIMKRDYLPLSRTPEEIALMRALKGVLDPKGILNPGVIFEAAGG